MEAHFKLTDDEFEMQFKDCTLDPKIFSHEAHLRLAFIHIRKYGLGKAIQNICDQIRKFDQTFGDGTKYNEELTIACVKLIDHLIKKTPDSGFKRLLAYYPELKSDFRTTITPFFEVEDTI